jgi:hypothetical protein
VASVKAGGVDKVERREVGPEDWGEGVKEEVRGLIERPPRGKFPGGIRKRVLNPMVFDVSDNHDGGGRANRAKVFAGPAPGGPKSGGGRRRPV